MITRSEVGVEKEIYTYNDVVSSEEEQERLQGEGFAEKEGLQEGHKRVGGSSDAACVKAGMSPLPGGR